MHRNIMAAAHTDSADFAGTRRISVQPYAGGFLHTSGGYPVGSAYADYGFFQQMHIFFQAQRELLQVQDRIAHKLPRPVISDVAAPVYVIERSAYGTQLLFAQQHIGFLTAASQCIYMRMFAEYDTVHILLSCLLGMHKRIETRRLPVPRLGVGNGFPIRYFQFHKTNILFYRPTARGMIGAHARSFIRSMQRYEIPELYKHPRHRLFS